jgi:hypothetical protein
MAQPDAPAPDTSRSADASPAELAVWDFAGLLLTYWCNVRCAFCYLHSGPDRGGEMSIATALRFWRSLDRLAAAHGKSMRIHLAGGEPFGDWPRLAGLLRCARDAGLSPVEKIETNAFWATADGLTRARLELLDALGVGTLVISTDVYHQEFVPLERVQRCVTIARAVLGRERVRVRWWDALSSPLPLGTPNKTSGAGLRARVRQAGTPAPLRERAYRAALARHKDRLTGRAAEKLASLLPRYPVEHFRGERCVEQVLRSRHVHIDGYGNIFPGVCSGIIVGHAAIRTVEDVWHDLCDHWRENPVIEAVVSGGSFELMQRAKAMGYQELAGGYASKCHLCTHVRQFLVDRGIWPEYVGPRECYGPPSV